MSKSAVRKQRILDYLDNIQRQLEDIGSIPVPGKEFFLERKNFIQIKAIKYSLACAIQDVTRVCAHIASAMSLWRVRESEAEAILGLGEAGILPKELVERIKGMPAFRNRIIHDYLPNEFDAARLLDALQSLDDLKVFSRHILSWLEDSREGDVLD